MDDNGHGTHCAGIVGATTDNGIGIAGVCLRQACFLCTFEKTQGQNNSMFWPLAKNSRIFSPKTQSYEAQSETWWYRILALKL